jgi:hypothetical protein
MRHLESWQRSWVVDRGYPSPWGRWYVDRSVEMQVIANPANVILLAGVLNR